MNYQMSRRTGCVRMEKSRQWFVAAFMAGFICGILFANLFAKEYVTESGIFDPYFLNQYARSDVPPREYIIYLCGIRILPLCFIILVGQTRIRKAMALFVLGWTGFAGGMLACAGILNMGLAGLAFLMIGLAPQLLFYALAYLVILWYFFHYPQARWNMGKTIFVILFLVAGLLTEAYVNPILMKLYLNTL